MATPGKDPDDEQIPQGYLAETREPVYAILLVVPMIALYEITVRFANMHDALELQRRNAADVLMQVLLVRMGLSLRTAYLASALVVVGALVIWQLARKHTVAPRGDYALVLVLESACYALALIAMSMLLDQYLLQTTPGGAGLAERIALSLGAGVYEEFVFRMVLIPVIATLAGAALGGNKRAALAFAVVLSAALFAAAHHLALGHEVFDARRFVFRALCGCVLGVVFVRRGFGAASASHALYNIFVSVFLDSGG